MAQSETPTPDPFGLRPIAESTILGGEDIRLIIARIIRAVLGLLGIIALALIMYAGYTIMTSAGNEERVATGKKILTNAVIGIAIILSALAIVQFIINKLAAATGYQFGDAGGGAPTWQTFAGSGALGRAVRDHYPFRDQTDVARNTKISVTFNEPIDPATIIRRRADSRTHGTTRLGECADPSTLAPGAFTWDIHCDSLNVDAVKITVEGSGGTQIPVAAAAMALYEGANENVFTVVFRPLALLGDNVQPKKYTVELTDAILRKADPARPTVRGTIFDRTSCADHVCYFWPFTTATTLDNTPPTVVADQLYPERNARVDKNAIIQVTFDEPMDPTAVQGQLKTAGNFTNMVFSRADQTPATYVTGEWKVANGYRTAEFISSQPCGVQNSCGEPMYCLPANGQPNDDSITPYQALLRTGDLLGGLPFEAVPFSGVMDMAGNALDGSGAGANGAHTPAAPIHPARPNTLAEKHTIGSQERTAAGYPPDNFGWDFQVRNHIDLQPPYIERVTPGIDAEDIPEQQEVRVNFSRPMLYGSLAGAEGVTIDEYGVPAASQDPASPAYLASLWWWVEARNSGVEPNVKTSVKVNHRAFGPNNLDLYYFVKTNSKVKSVYQNCLYPGRGPAPLTDARGQSPACGCTETSPGVLGCNANCVPVTVDPNLDTGCVQTSDRNDQLKFSIDSPPPPPPSPLPTPSPAPLEHCISAMKRLSPLSPPRL